MLLTLLKLVSSHVDCPVVIQFAQQLKMDVVNPSQMTKIRSDCCTSGGITCDPIDSKISYLNWSSYGLVGNMSAINVFPPNLVTLDLSNNTITGELVNLLPSTLSYLNLYDNQISGYSENSFPNRMMHIDLHNNNISGVIYSFPQSLKYLDLSKNFLVGQLPSFPRFLSFLYLNDNTLSGRVPMLPDSLTDLNLGDARSKKHNSFNESISMNTPHTLSIYSNYITDVYIKDTSKISNCDLSFNPLLGRSSIVNLTAFCKMDGLYAFPYQNKSTVLVADSFRNISEIKVLSRNLSEIMFSTVLRNTSGTITISNIETNTLEIFGQPTLKLFQFKGWDLVFVPLRLLISFAELAYILVHSPFRAAFRRFLLSRNYSQATSRENFLDIF